MTPIDRVRAHFDALGKRKIEIPEWGVTGYATPVTISERNQIYSGLEKTDENGAIVRMVIFKLKNGEGHPVFTIADEPALRSHADSSVLVRVASEIMAADTPKSAELGNS